MVDVVGTPEVFGIGAPGALRVRSGNERRGDRQPGDERPDCGSPLPHLPSSGWSSETGEQSDDILRGRRGTKKGPMSSDGKRIGLVVFDLDGTLVDSSVDIA